MMLKAFTLPTVFLLALATTASNAAEIDGFTEPSRDLDLAAADSGRIEEVNVEDGERVRKGQALASLNTDILDASRRIVEAQLLASGKLKSAQADLRLRTDRVTKLRSLFERGHATQEELDRAEIEREVAAANVEIVQEERAIHGIERERIDLQIERQFIRSPINGVVVRTFKDVGEFVSPADAVVVRVVQLHPLVATFNVPASAVSNELSVGREATVLLGRDRKSVSAKVEFVSPIVEPQSGTVRVKVEIANRDETLRAGEKCRLVIAGVVDRIASGSE